MRMLYLHRGPFSGINEALLGAWRRGAPQVDVQLHDVAAGVLRGFRGRLRALPQALRRGGLRALSGGGHFDEAVGHSRWLMERLDRVVQRTQVAGAYDFSFSTGTYVPVTQPARPHFVYTDHTILTNRRYPNSEDRVRLWQDCLPWERETLRRATMVFTMSEHVRRTLLEDYGVPDARVLRVNAGCNVPPGPEPDPARYAAKRILFVGLEWERKGGPELVAAFERVRKAHPAAVLTIVGCRPDVAGPGIEIEGRVGGDAVAAFLSRASVFCMPSWREPFGIAYIEALRAGLPVVSWDLGATPDFVREGETGHRVAAGDVATLASRLEALLADPDACRRMGERGRTLAETEYTWERTQGRIWEAIAGRLGA